MKGIKIHISGENRNDKDFLELLREIIHPRFERIEGNLHIFLCQNYSFGTDSDLAITAFLKFEELKYTLEIFSSGGGEGIFGFTLGSENRSLISIKNKIEDFCREKKFKFDCNEINV
jgi:hypothetical protein